MCYTRTYEYLLPAGVLCQGTGSDAAAEGQIAELNSILSGFQGRHPFYNYTVRSRYQNVDSKPVYLSRVSAFQSADEFLPDSLNEAASDLVTPQDDLTLGIDEDSVDPSSVEELGGDFDGSDEPTLLKARWIFEPDTKDKVRNAHFRHILSCSCSSELETCGNARFLRISITGESFMLHQIRKIVGTSVAVLWGVLPRDLIPLSLARHSRIVLPLAPSQGLILVDHQFHNFKLPSSYARSPSTTLNAGKEPRLEPSVHVQVKNEMRSFLQNVFAFVGPHECSLGDMGGKCHFSGSNPRRRDRGCSTSLRFLAGANCNKQGNSMVIRGNCILTGRKFHFLFVGDVLTLPRKRERTG